MPIAQTSVFVVMKRAESGRPRISGAIQRALPAPSIERDISCWSNSSTMQLKPKSQIIGVPSFATRMLYCKRFITMFSQLIQSENHRHSQL